MLRLLSQLPDGIYMTGSTVYVVEAGKVFKTELNTPSQELGTINDPPNSDQQ